MSVHNSQTSSQKPVKKARKLVLCFDGTGNSFKGNTSDTNVVKIYEKLDRYDDSQYHYYQPGIGTYDISGGSINKSKIGYAKSKISKVVDQAIATSFDAHVMAGYRFLMNHYKPGAKIYMFGFSRGAYTARFLARMINSVGLLSKGNHEMIPFAYSLYQDYEQAKGEKKVNSNGYQSVGSDDADNAEHKMINFANTFCRRGGKNKQRVKGEPDDFAIKVYFLGIFDCVGSVAVLETPFGQTPKPVSVIGTAEHVRHAVAVDEFRVKFKPALLEQDKAHEKSDKDEDIKEVWFPGNHGDVGGGWPARKQETKDAQGTKWDRFTSGVRAFFYKDVDKVPTANITEDLHQMSDIPLSWMIREIELLGDQEKEYALQWSDRLTIFKTNFKETEALAASRHNAMSFSRGCSWLIVLMWKFMEYVPLFPRYELEEGNWNLRTWPPNKASARDIPEKALLHASLFHRVANQRHRPYEPRNNHGSGNGSGSPCLIAKEFIKINEEEKKDPKVDHTLYALNQPAVDAYILDRARIARIRKEKMDRKKTDTVNPPTMTNGSKIF